MPSPLGVVIVTYDSIDVVLDCLETLLAAAIADGTALHVAVVDNASSDGTAAAVQAWASGKTPYTPPADLPFAHHPVPKPLSAGVLTLIEAEGNGGFAAGVNIGLEHLFANPEIHRVWVLNPDSVVPPGTPAAFASHDPGPFALMGGRVTYYDRPDMIQIDGGTLNRWTGVTGNINLYSSALEVPMPDATRLDFVTGASMVVSRDHYETAGPVPEDYFLYYEEGDWAMRRGALPLAVCPGARVYHRGGSAIGSPVPGRPASPFSLYFKHRARMYFVRRHLPLSTPTAWLYTLAKSAQYARRGWRDEAVAVLAGAADTAPPVSVRERLDSAAAERAFPKRSAKAKIDRSGSA